MLEGVSPRRPLESAMTEKVPSCRRWHTPITIRHDTARHGTTRHDTTLLSLSFDSCRCPMHEKQEGQSCPLPPSSLPTSRSRLASARVNYQISAVAATPFPVFLEYHVAIASEPTPKLTPPRVHDPGCGDPRGWDPSTLLTCRYRCLAVTPTFIFYDWSSLSSACQLVKFGDDQLARNIFPDGKATPFHIRMRLLPAPDVICHPSGSRPLPSKFQIRMPAVSSRLLLAKNNFQFVAFSRHYMVASGRYPRFISYRR